MPFRFACVHSAGPLASVAGRRPRVCAWHPPRTWSRVRPRGSGRAAARVTELVGGWWPRAGGRAVVGSRGRTPHLVGVPLEGKLGGNAGGRECVGGRERVRPRSHHRPHERTWCAATRPPHHCAATPPLCVHSRDHPQARSPAQPPLLDPRGRTRDHCPGGCHVSAARRAPLQIDIMLDKFDPDLLALILNSLVDARHFFTRRRLASARNILNALSVCKTLSAHGAQHKTVMQDALDQQIQSKTRAMQRRERIRLLDHFRYIQRPAVRYWVHVEWTRLATVAPQGTFVFGQDSVWVTVTCPHCQIKPTEHGINPGHRLCHTSRDCPGYVIAWPASEARKLASALEWLKAQARHAADPDTNALPPRPW